MLMYVGFMVDNDDDMNDMMVVWLYFKLGIIIFISNDFTQYILYLYDNANTSINTMNREPINFY